MEELKKIGFADGSIRRLEIDRDAVMLHIELWNADLLTLTFDECIHLRCDPQILTTDMSGVTGEQQTDLVRDALSRYYTTEEAQTESLGDFWHIEFLCSDGEVIIELVASSVEVDLTRVN
jgi:hypothetical protein